MQFIGSAVTDVGISKKTNQDSVCLKIAATKRHGQIAMIVLCDGMGGLEKGELASATVVREFSNWYERKLPNQLNSFSLKSLSAEWAAMIKELNYRIGQYGKNLDGGLGTTVTAMLIVDDKYMICHVGDSRVYEIINSIIQLTEDQTFVAREVKRGAMTPEEAKIHPKRNMLLQCVGASRSVEPQIIQGRIKKNSVFMLCSDGFRHVLSEEEMYSKLNFSSLSDKSAMEQNSRYLIDLVKNRKEKDNITLAVLKCI